MVYCPECGKKLESELTVCPYCGYKLSTESRIGSIIDNIIDTSCTFITMFFKSKAASIKQECLIVLEMYTYFYTVIDNYFALDGLKDSDREKLGLIIYNTLTKDHLIKNLSLSNEEITKMIEDRKKNYAKIFKLGFKDKMLFTYQLFFILAFSGLAVSCFVSSGFTVHFE